MQIIIETKKKRRDVYHFDFGRYEGAWTEWDGGSVFEILIDETNFHPLDHNISNSNEGFFEWRIIKDDKNRFGDCFGRQAMEKIRGFFIKKKNYYSVYFMNSYRIKTIHSWVLTDILFNSITKRLLKP